MEKIDIMSFSKAQMTARLFVILRNFQNKYATYPELDKLMEYVTKITEENFEFPLASKKQVVDNLCMFILGNEDNVFSKSIK